MPRASLLSEFYNEDLGEYYYADDLYYHEDSAGYYGEYYDEEEGLYYEDEILYYEDDDEGMYYQEEWLYYEEDDGALYYSDELVYYEEEEPAMYFKKEVNISPQVINTPRDAQGNSWDASSYEIDKEIENIAYEEDVDYATAYRIFGARYDTYEPDLGDYI